ncbi:phenazine biosynthesis protein, PhzF family [Methanosarcina horonobensis HB-1 = JCM 15518]|uniref:Phenazine biosynthesis protein, PhzF family n=1 Tax=Methanosarcina horonobensis HB-1 = JCM 15518 TaxID=1434110 RepID=A0A0E3SC78_9EURY|nr:PhzF family phenazine biosynthesis protein [Methanosarcina horonobensis]AKB79559.1 phenazine biosynthesis protein, PhzF family [Methanosarcina horonobensis HB-1 = JCM 15518]
MKLFQVDAFTNKLFKGNPAGVCILPENFEDNDMLMQNIAMEMNVSETAFVVKKNDEYNLRWFTPETEVEFCGHATLSSAHILWEIGIVKSEDKIIFNTKSGKLFAGKSDNKIELDFPVIEVIEVSSNEMINSALGVEPLFTGTDGKRYLLEINDYNELINMKPNFEKLKEIGKTAFMVTCKSNNDKYDFYSRFFAPAVGINEDPVTGSAHSYLAPYWSRKLHKNVLYTFQASKQGGEIECELNKERVLLRGNAKTVFEITFECRLPGKRIIE